MVTRRMMSAAVLLVLVTAGCGAKDEPGVASVGGPRPATAGTSAPAGDREEQLRQFAQCMRDHGVDMPDPQPGQGPAGGLAGGGLMSDPDFQSAFAACRTRLPNGGEPPKLSADQLERYLDFAECMRGQGVDVPDPDPDGTLRLGDAIGRINPSDPKVQAAFTACREKLGRVMGGPSGTPS